MGCFIRPAVPAGVIIYLAVRNLLPKITTKEPSAFDSVVRKTPDDRRPDSNGVLRWTGMSRG